MSAGSTDVGKQLPRLRWTVLLYVVLSAGTMGCTTNPAGEEPPQLFCYAHSVGLVHDSNRRAVEEVTYCAVGFMDLMQHPERYHHIRVEVSGYYDMCRSPSAVAFRPEALYGAMRLGETLEIVDGWEHLKYEGPGYYVLLGRAVPYRPEWSKGGTFLGIEVEDVTYRAKPVRGLVESSSGESPMSEDCIAALQFAFQGRLYLENGVVRVRPRE